MEKRSIFIFVLLFSAFLFPNLLVAQKPGHKDGAAISANDFLNSIGVNSAVSRRGETLAKTIEITKYLGIRWIRSGFEGGLPVEDLIDNVGLQFLTIPNIEETLMPSGTKYADYATCHNYFSHPSHPGLYDNQTWNAADPGKLCKVDGLWGNYDESGNQQYGFYKSDYSPRKSAVYLHNLTTILADSKPGSFMKKLGYSIPNKPETTQDLLLQKDNGQFELVVWGEKVNENDNIRVNLGKKFHAVRIYDPTIGTSATKTLANVKSIELTVSHHPLIIELEK